MQAADYADLSDAEDAAKRLQSAHDDTQASMRADIEALRAELHQYEALAPSGRLHVHGEELRSSLAGLEPANCLAFRQAPVLQAELGSLANACAGSNVIYDAPAAAIHTKAELLVEVRRHTVCLVVVVVELDRSSGRHDSTD
jgi:hypothetical protein